MPTNMDKHGTKLYNLWLKQRRLKKRLALLVIVCVVMLIYLWPKYFTGQKTGQPPTTNTTSQPLTLPKGNPDYRTLLPAGKTIDSLGGWTRVSPTGANPVYSYTDTIGPTSIAVSQQPLPSDFADNPDDGVADIARSSGATRHISVNNTVIYIAVAANNRQSLFLTKSGLLILIKSTAVVSDDQWVSYINSLQ